MLRILVSVLTGFGQMRLEQWKSDAVPGCSDLGDVLWMSMYFSSNLSVQKSLLCIHIFLSLTFIHTALLHGEAKAHWDFSMSSLPKSCVSAKEKQRLVPQPAWRQACGCLCLCVSDSSGLHFQRGYVAGCCWSAVWIHIHGTVWSWWEDSKSLCWARQQCLGCDEAIIAPWQHCILALGRACFASALVLVFPSAIASAQKDVVGSRRDQINKTRVQTHGHRWLAVQATTASVEELLPLAPVCLQSPRISCCTRVGWGRLVQECCAQSGHKPLPPCLGAGLPGRVPCNIPSLLQRQRSRKGPFCQRGGQSSELTPQPQMLLLPPWQVQC